MKKQFLLITIFLTVFTGLSAVYRAPQNAQDWQHWKERREKFLEHHNITVAPALLQEEAAEMNRMNGNGSVTTSTQSEKMRYKDVSDVEPETMEKTEKASQTMHHMH